ncbi:hypothetical protein EIP91_001330 [Steccherinum ochraceum]|uniref:Coenzyme Q-binding protein COQ10 START domain-containing protein n=1 Tax=Steccherinum ochraceum TaxID=92696 RepID=A0A4R0RE49_9APHY|nr:hypothetical protein EIP91_001330 [Steccherinum ochraceum]
MWATWGYLGSKTLGVATKQWTWLYIRFVPAKPRTPLTEPLERVVYDHRTLEAPESLLTLATPARLRRFLVPGVLVLLLGFVVQYRYTPDVVPFSQEMARPNLSQWTLSVSTSLSIRASREKVWSNIMGLPSYPQWNPYIREATIVDSSRKPLPETTSLSASHKLLLKTHMPPTMDASVKTTDMLEHVKLVDPQEFRVVWGSTGSGILFGAEVWLMLSEEGSSRTKFEMVTVFKGVAAHIIKTFMGGTVNNLHQSLVGMAEGLKRVSEGD